MSHVDEWAFIAKITPDYPAKRDVSTYYLRVHSRCTRAFLTRFQERVFLFWKASPEPPIVVCLKPGSSHNSSQVTSVMYNYEEGRAQEHLFDDEFMEDVL